ncbi:pyridoxamine 5'-phosphate oxidase family protein [Kingella negevensis]|uniref:pyridoxamine 5'-phosphate oxidase family protein n=1 Tax=Kingella negevensis TaxID=1522312 RepID=UPI00050A11E9|nr:pyridoxamine 5'-phosphate oxidase family protein [Kingella negevensis]MDK4689531.1 pyridoxamine 5'-phosphate oxidase family protein [Kingella negevensis]WII90787.1 pyridoxamine 5'-phosphate oxidase family protein [Kingella negevensis]
MNALPKNVTKFLTENRVVTIACAQNNQAWAVNCFYVLNEDTAALIVFTKRTTHHAEIMLANPNVAGTVSVQPEGILGLSGLQFAARAELLEQDDPRRAQFRNVYTGTVPAAKLMDSDVWLLHLDSLKYTDNKMVVARKTKWERNNAA